MIGYTYQEALDCGGYLPSVKKEKYYMPTDLYESVQNILKGKKYMIYKTNGQFSPIKEMSMEIDGHIRTDPLDQTNHMVNTKVKSLIHETFDIDRVVFNDPATIVFWADGTKTVVKCAPGQKFNKYQGFCAAVTKRLYVHNSYINRIVESGEDQNPPKAETLTQEQIKKAFTEKSKNGKKGSRKNG